LRFKRSLLAAGPLALAAALGVLAPAAHASSTHPAASAAPAASTAHASLVAHSFPSTIDPTIPLPDDTGDAEPDISGGQPLCKASGFHGCIRIVNNDGTPGTGLFIVNDTPGPAENLKFIADAGSFTFRTHNYTAGRLYFTGHPNICVKAVNANDTATGRCDLDNVVVGRGYSNGHRVWIFRSFTQQLNDLRVVGSFDSYGSFVHQVSWFDTDYYKRWDWGFLGLVPLFGGAWRRSARWLGRLTRRN
jgi:hypothetical protein